MPAAGAARHGAARQHLTSAKLSRPRCCSSPAPLGTRVTECVHRQTASWRVGLTCCTQGDVPALACAARAQLAARLLTDCSWRRGMLPRAVQVDIIIMQSDHSSPTAHEPAVCST